MTENKKTNCFKNSQGGYYLRGIFFETTGMDKSSVVYTLKDQEHEGFPSLYQLYLDLEDPTEYEFANAYLDGWGHWESLCQCTWFKPYIARWRKELELKFKARSLKKIRDIAESGDKDSYQANKYLLEHWKTSNNRRGRPTKDEISSEAKRMAEDSRRIKEDAERLGIKVVK